VIEIRRYVTAADKDVFGHWLSRLADNHAKREFWRESTGWQLATSAIPNSFAAAFQSYGSTGDRDTGFITHCSGKHACCCYAEATTQAVLRHSTGYRVSAGLSGKDAMKSKHQASISHDEALLRQLREDPDFAAEYLRAALEDTDEPRVLLIALRRIAEARGGLAKVAKAAGVERESLYRALSPNGNPRLSTLAAVAKAMGLKLTVETA